MSREAARRYRIVSCVSCRNGEKTLFHVCSTSAAMPSKPARKPRLFLVRPAARKPPKRNRSSNYNTYICEPTRPFTQEPTAANHPEMSSITPPSFVDDGGSFNKRVPRGLDECQVAEWVCSSRSETSRYTGSFFDDGADMHFRSGATPGFGPVDTRFYKQKKRKEPKGGEKAWNDDIQKAISGDVQRNLEKIRDLRGLQVKGAVAKNVRGKDREKDTVTVPMPLQWGTFVIKSDDGRIIVVDKDGEFDSGPRKIDEEQERQRQHPWVKVASTLAPPSPLSTAAPPPLPERRSTSMQQKAKERPKSRNKRRSQESSRHAHHSPPKALTPIQESEYEDGHLFSGVEDIGSPTGFMMTGGASGWPSRNATSTASPAASVSEGHGYVALDSVAKKVRDGYRHVKPVSHGYENTFPESFVKSKPVSPVRSLSGKWFSPESLSLKNPAKTVPYASWDGGQFEDAWKAGSPARTTRSGGSRRYSESTEPSKVKDVGNVSAKSRSTYKAPTVEDAPSTSSASSNDSTIMGWGGSLRKSQISKKDDSHSSGGSMKNDDKSWTSTPTFPHPHTWAYAPGQPFSEQSWGSRPKAADNPAWTGIEPFTSQQRAASPTRPSSVAAWDGYELDKTLSDMSIAGSGSERGSLRSNSQVSRYPPTRDGHGGRSSHDGGSSRHSTIQPLAWEDGSNSSSPKRKARVQDSTRGWEDAEGSRSARSDGSSRSGRRSHSRGAAGWWYD